MIVVVNGHATSVATGSTWVVSTATLLVNSST
jgi:hypothetical protein